MSAELGMWSMVGLVRDREVTWMERRSKSGQGTAWLHTSRDGLGSTALVEAQRKLIPGTIYVKLKTSDPICDHWLLHHRSSYPGSWLWQEPPLLNWYVGLMLIPIPQACHKQANFLFPKCFLTGDPVGLALGPPEGLTGGCYCLL